jgi:hypothetical protein
VESSGRARVTAAPPVGPIAAWVTDRLQEGEASKIANFFEGILHARLNRRQR